MPWCTCGRLLRQGPAAYCSSALARRSSSSLKRATSAGGRSRHIRTSGHQREQAQHTGCVRCLSLHLQGEGGRCLPCLCTPSPPPTTLPHPPSCLISNTQVSKRSCQACAPTRSVASMKAVPSLLP